MKVASTRRLPRRMSRLALCGLAAVAAGSCGDVAPTSNAQRIATTHELIGGRKAIGRIGDYLLQNDKIRLIVQDKGDGRGNALYGGTLIDADLVRPGGADGHGNDQLGEILPAFLFSIIEPTDVTVSADGSDGGPASITVSGPGADFLETIALVNQGLLYPPSLSFTETFTLEPGKQYVEIKSTVKNISAGAQPLPFLNPSQFQNLLGTAIPGVSNLQLSVPMGHLLLLGAEQALFAPGVAGFNIRFAVETSYTMGAGFPAFPGLVADYVATHGDGVSYGFTVPVEDSNYINAFKSLYAIAQTVTPNSVLMCFTYSAVAGVFTANPPPILESGQSFTYTSDFIVARGDAASVYDVIQEMRGTTYGDVGGIVIGERTESDFTDVSLIIRQDLHDADPTNDPIVTQISPDTTSGAFKAHLPPGDYRYRIVSDSREIQPEVPFTITANTLTSLRVTVQPSGTLAVSVIDELGRPAPIKLTLVSNFDQSHLGENPRDFLYSIALGERKRATSVDPTRTDYIENVFYVADGRVVAPVRPGTYDAVVTRGPEYEATHIPVTVVAGSVAQYNVQLTRAFPSNGWVAGDFHLHSTGSTDSGLSYTDRVISAAGEGLDIATSTDHNYISDLSPYVDNLGLIPWLMPIIGIELTTFELGHFGGYPLKVDPGSTRGGEFTWTKQPPDAIFAQIRNTLAADPNNIIVQINHPRTTMMGYFAEFFVDSETADTYQPSGISSVLAPYGSEFQSQNLSYDFDALEVFSAKVLIEVHSFRAPNPLPPPPTGGYPDPQPVAGEIVRDAEGHPTFPGTAETWFTMLDRGLRPTGMGNSDSHGTLFDGEPGYARTMLFVGQGKDTIGMFSQDDVIAAIKGHHAIATDAPLIEMTVGSAIIGDDVSVPGGQVNVSLSVHSPSWAPVTHVRLYSNKSTVVADLDVPTSQGTSFTAVVPLTLTQDSWLVAEATGTQNMFPQVTGNEYAPIDINAIIGALGAGFSFGPVGLTPDPTYPLTPFAITNPIWVDVDGGGWTPPSAPLTRSSHPPATTSEVGDVRERFRNFSELGTPSKAAQ